MENINWKIVGGSANNMWKIPISCGKYQYHGGYCHINWKIADVMGISYELADDFFLWYHVWCT